MRPVDRWAALLRLLLAFAYLLDHHFAHEQPQAAIYTILSRGAWHQAVDKCAAHPLCAQTTMAASPGMRVANTGPLGRKQLHTSYIVCEELFGKHIKSSSFVHGRGLTVAALKV